MGSLAWRGLFSSPGSSLLLDTAPLSRDSAARLETAPLPRLPASPPDTALTVYLMTMGPGKRVWERFGHNAIWIHDPVSGTDQAYNYGLFDFRQQNFLLRFIQGRMWYWMQGFPAQSYVEPYRRANRSVWVQELEMPPGARRELQEFLEWNERPENRFYHYDYYRDNCSTRVRDALDRALGGRIREQTPRTRSPAGPTASTPSVSPPTIRWSTPDCCWRSVIRWTGRSRPGRRCFFRSPCGSTCGRSRSPAPTAARATGQIGADAVPVERADASTQRRRLAPDLSCGTAWRSAGRCSGCAMRCRTSRPRGIGVSAGDVDVVSGGGHRWDRAGRALGLTDHAAAYDNENVLQVNLLALPLLWLLPGRVRRSGQGEAGAAGRGHGSGTVTAGTDPEAVSAILSGEWAGHRPRAAGSPRRRGGTRG